MKLAILILATLLGTPLDGQILYRERLHPGVREIYTRYFSGSGGRGFTSVEQLDGQGRVIRKRSLRNGKLLSDFRYAYSPYGDLTEEEEHYSINAPDGTDYQVTHAYVYGSDSLIIRKETQLPGGDRITIELTRREGDSLRFYREANTLPDGSPASVKDHLLVYDAAGYLSRWEIWQELPEAGRQHIVTRYRYNDRGLLTHRTIVRDPPYPEPSVYVGGPGGDDQVYSYQYDRQGRVRRKFVTVAGRRYKLARYRYRPD